MPARTVPRLHAAPTALHPAPARKPEGRHPGHISAALLALLYVASPFAVASPTESSGYHGSAGRHVHAQQLVRGAKLPSTNGIYVNDQDELFVTSVVGRSITQLNPRNGRVIRTLGPAQGVEAPDDLVFDHAGNLYWTAFLTGEVGRMTPAGEKTTVANLGRGVNAITISEDGNTLYVSRVFLADEVWAIDLTGTNPPHLIAKDLGGFNGMDIGPDGKLYGPLWYHGQVARIDPATSGIEIVANGLATPAAVKFNAAGELFVIDQARGQVLRVDTGNGTLQAVAEVGEGADNLAFDSKGRLYVSNAHDAAIRRVKLNPDESDVRLLTRGGVTTAGGVALHQANGRTSLFVADIYSLREYAPRTGRLRGIAHSVVGGVTPLNTPFSLAPHGDYLVTTSWFSNAVQVWDPELEDVVTDYRDFSVPLNAIGFGNDLVVAELGSRCVVQQLANTTERIPLGCGFTVPVGLAQRDGKVWVSDWATGSVWQVAEGYKALASPKLVASGLIQPEGLAATLSGSLLVVETGADRLVKLDLSTGERSTLAKDLPIGNSGTPGYPPSWIFNGVAVDDCDVAYVSVDGDRSIWRIADKKAARCDLSR